MNIPLPEFWFPPGWNLEYQLPEDDVLPGHGYLRRGWSREDCAAWHRQAGTSCDELKDLAGWKSRVMVDHYAKYATEHLTVAEKRIERRAVARGVAAMC